MLSRSRTVKCTSYKKRPTALNVPVGGQLSKCEPVSMLRGTCREHTHPYLIVYLRSGFWVVRGGKMHDGELDLF